MNLFNLKFPTQFFQALITIAFLLTCWQELNLTINAQVRIFSKLSPKESFDQALKDVKVYRPWKVRPLIPLRFDPENHTTVVVTLAPKENDFIMGENFTKNRFIWVTVVPEVQEICRNFQKKDLKLNLNQLLGLAPDTNLETFVILRVKEGDIFRPALDKTTSTIYPCTYSKDQCRPSNCGEELQVGIDLKSQEWLSHLSFLKKQSTVPFPWTGLGYTYNWNPDASDIYGATEYVIKDNASITVIDKISYTDYCNPQSKY
ncbi:MAG TPA: hypothetical protein VIL74_07285 [Pyrinomonadaceae bacterium]|jgi:hypothetical protein